MKKHFIVAGASLGVCISLGLWFSWSETVTDVFPASEKVKASEQPSLTDYSTHTINNRDRRNEFASVSKQLERTSLNGLDIPQSFNTNRKGDLIVNEELRDGIEFFRALNGELSSDNIRQLYALAAYEQCNAHCAESALQIYDQYVQYVDVLASRLPGLTQNTDPLSRLADIIHLRREILGQTLADALFGYEEQYDSLRLQQQAITQDQTLGPAQKQQRLHLLELNYDADLLETSQQQNDFQVKREQATDALNDLYRQRQEWDQRYQLYREALLQLQQSSLSHKDIRAQTDRLRQQFFTTTESKRVAALDRIHFTRQTSRTD